MKERWRDIEKFVGYYQISNLGRIRSVDREIETSHGITRKLKGTILEIQTIGKSENPQAATPISRDCVRSNIHIARAVMLAFGKKSDKEKLRIPYNAKGSSRWVVIHKDGDIYNCKIDNLEVISWSERSGWIGARASLGPVEMRRYGKVTVFPHLEAAVRKTGFTRYLIKRCCDGERTKTLKSTSFKWKKGPCGKKVR